jgi:hypothetical protein
VYLGGLFNCFSLSFIIAKEHKFIEVNDLLKAKRWF